MQSDDVQVACGRGGREAGRPCAAGGMQATGRCARISNWEGASNGPNSGSGGGRAWGRNSAPAINGAYVIPRRL